MDEDVIYTMEYYSSMRMKDIQPFVTTWLEFEDIMQSEINQTERQRQYDTINMWNPKKPNS